MAMDEVVRADPRLCRDDLPDDPGQQTHANAAQLLRDPIPVLVPVFQQHYQPRHSSARRELMGVWCVWGHWSVCCLGLPWCGGGVRW